MADKLDPLQLVTFEELLQAIMYYIWGFPPPLTIAACKLETNSMIIRV